MSGPFSSRSLCVCLIALAMPLGAVAQNIDIDYRLIELDCTWLENEYQRVLDANAAPPHEIPPKVKTARMFATPVGIVANILGLKFDEPRATPLGGRVNFSGDVDDIEDASRHKNCYQLTDMIFRSREGGELAGISAKPIRSVLEADPQ